MRPRSAGLALAALLAPLAAACGSQPPGVFHPAGAPVTYSPAAADAVPARDAPFPGRVSFDFGPLPSSPQQAALVSTDRDFILAYYYAVYTRGRSHRYASYVGDENVRLSVAGNIAQQVAAHRGYAGVTRYFDTTVQPLPGYHGEQSVTYCVDESRLDHTDVRTGRVVPKGYPPDRQYYRESDTFARGRHGAWKVVGTLVSYYPNGQARECKP
jgi:hypothetical protein